ncbi:metallophosphoesterase [Flavihumibacter sp. CACIAM 22H1]|uniref:metallophosphoesterase n=1 Tax=Flavihumibacter sp. CACIAM 22H1 TaxID=1812911 RepID=UPI0007A8F9CB|nr:metallophosphoesterase [Flavihumibacter sp. CACIAM 22H1]KYP16182.1 MAG: metallophosphatase [Flavihumibacter sp. CACIAM 22H1]
MKRTFVIGDIHGALKAVEQVIAQIHPLPDDSFIFLGDYVDGWSESAATIDFLVNFRTRFNCVFLRGNHDQWCQHWLENKASQPEWLHSGGYETIKSYEGFGAAAKAEHLHFFQSLENYHIDASNRLFIHAGFASMHGPLKEHYVTNYYWDRSLWEMALSMDPSLEPGHPFYPKRLLQFREIYIGHTPTTNYGISTPVNRKNLWNLDTGAGFTGLLSAIEIETKTIVQSEKVSLLYPHEKGRNK